MTEYIFIPTEGVIKPCSVICTVEPTLKSLYEAFYKSQFYEWPTRLGVVETEIPRTYLLTAYDIGTEQRVKGSYFVIQRSA